jgi:hypothetical protein
MLKCSLFKFFLLFMIDHGNVSLYVCIVHYIYIYIERERERERELTNLVLI